MCAGVWHLTAFPACALVFMRLKVARCRALLKLLRRCVEWCCTGSDTLQHPRRVAGEHGAAAAAA